MIAAVDSTAHGPGPPAEGGPVPTLYVCHGDDGGPRLHPCRRVQEALREAGIPYEKVVAAQGNPIPFLRKGSREELREATGDTKLPALRSPDGRVLSHSRAILRWIKEQRSRKADAEGS
jgi:glutathione S-transferase